MYKMICVDLDGTLLDSRGKVSNTNKKAIKKALDAGLEVVIVSGRPNCFTKRIIKTIDNRMGHITFNGGYYRVADAIRHFPIDFESVKAIARIARKYKTRAYFKNKNVAICTKSNPLVHDYDYYRSITDEKDLLDFYYYIDAVTYFDENKMDVWKIFFWDDDVDLIMGPVLDEIKQLPGLNIFEYADFFEICSDQTSKGLAIKNVAQDLHIDLKDVVCIGDNTNDLPMFEVAGLSVAMGNGPKCVREKVDRITLTNDENGVAYAIENYILK